MSPADDAPDHVALGERRAGRRWPTWLLAMLTVAAAVYVMAFALGAAMNTAGCRGKGCPNMDGLSLFSVLFFGAPTVTVMAVIGSFFSAKRRRGFLVPLGALVLLAVDLAVLAELFRR